jgi:hypothetical protein
MGGPARRFRRIPTTRTRQHVHRKRDERGQRRNTPQHELLQQAEMMGNPAEVICLIRKPYANERHGWEEREATHSRAQDRRYRNALQLQIISSEAVTASCQKMLQSVNSYQKRISRARTYNSKQDRAISLLTRQPSFRLIASQPDQQSGVHGTELRKPSHGWEGECRAALAGLVLGRDEPPTTSAPKMRDINYV